MALYQKELRISLKTIKQASKAIMMKYRNGFNVSIKDDSTFVTNADFASETIIRNALIKNFPEYGILSEETFDNKDRLNKDYCFIVDPLDGTKDFVNKTNNFAINIALSYKGKIVLGVIAVPYYHKIYYAVDGKGSYKIHGLFRKKIHVSNRTDSYRMLASKYFFKDNDVYSKNKLIESITNIGSSYKACLIAEGKADLCVKTDPNSKEWDIAPFDLIVKEAGGIVTDIYGSPYTFNKDNVVNIDGFIVTNSKESLNKFVYKK